MGSTKNPEPGVRSWFLVLAPPWTCSVVLGPSLSLCELRFQISSVRQKVRQPLRRSPAEASWHSWFCASRMGLSEREGVSQGNDMCKELVERGQRENKGLRQNQHQAKVDWGGRGGEERPGRQGMMRASCAPGPIRSAYRIPFTTTLGDRSHYCLIHR